MSPGPGQPPASLLWGPDQKHLLEEQPESAAPAPVSLGPCALVPTPPNEMLTWLWARAASGQALAQCPLVPAGRARPGSSPQRHCPTQCRDASPFPPPLTGVQAPELGAKPHRAEERRFPNKPCPNQGEPSQGAVRFRANLSKRHRKWSPCCHPSRVTVCWPALRGDFREVKVGTCQQGPAGVQAGELQVRTRVPLPCALDLGFRDLA